MLSDSIAWQSSKTADDRAIQVLHCIILADTASLRRQKKVQSNITDQFRRRVALSWQYPLPLGWPFSVAP
jgi:hypothetical protein